MGEINHARRVMGSSIRVRKASGPEHVAVFQLSAVKHMAHTCKVTTCAIRNQKSCKRQGTVLIICACIVCYCCWCTQHQHSSICFHCTSSYPYVLYCRTAIMAYMLCLLLQQGHKDTDRLICVADHHAGKHRISCSCWVSLSLLSLALRLSNMFSFSAILPATVVH